MLSPLAQRVLQHIHKRELMRAGDRVAVAVSGGADSVALLRLLLELRAELGVVLSVAHFNHRIRGKEADADEQFVRDLAREHDLRFWYADADVPAYARESKFSLEAAARFKRYEFLENIVSCGSVNKVATAHTRGDQAETVLMRIIRGTGVSGLAGIYESVKIEEPDTGDEIGAIVRPLLATRRDDLETYLGSLSQPWREDATNADLHHTRNRIRQLVIPLLEREFNPAIRDRLAELAEIARGEEEFWRNVERQPLYARDPNLIPLRKAALPIQRRLIRAFAQQHGLSLDFQRTECVRALISGEIQGTVDVGDGWIAELTPTHLRFRPAADEFTPYEYGFYFGGDVALPEIGIVLRSHSVGAKQQPDAFDQKKLPSSMLTVRPWRAGDRFWARHSSGPKKIKELLTDQHITGRDRQLWPVIACGDDIVWLRGFGISQAYVADESATDAVVVTEQPLES